MRNRKFGRNVVLGMVCAMLNLGCEPAIEGLSEGLIVGLTDVVSGLILDVYDRATDRADLGDGV